MAPTPGLLPGQSHGRRSLVGCRPRGGKSWTRLSAHTLARELRREDGAEGGSAVKREAQSLFTSAVSCI